MAKKKDNLKDLTLVDLNKKLEAAQESLRVLRFKMQGSASKNVKESKNLKKEIARIMTEITSKK